MFELEAYERLVYMDADGLAWRNMDHLFHLPPARVAMPRAYWMEATNFSDQIMGGCAVRGGGGGEGGCCVWGGVG